MYHVFQPIVTLTERDDGRYDMKCDWSSSLTHSGDATGEDRALDGPGQPGDLAAEALDVWLKQQPSTFVLYPAILRHENLLLTRDDDSSGPDWERARKLIWGMGGTIVGAFASSVRYPYCDNPCWGQVDPDDPDYIDRMCKHPVYTSYSTVRWA